MRAPRTRQSAFSLIEVLIATIVLSLGLLGLSALFAGAAVQQQRSAEVTDSVLFSTNLEALLKSRLTSAQVFSPMSNTINPHVYKWDVLYSEYVPPSYMIIGKTRHSDLEIQFASNEVENLDLPLPGAGIVFDATTLAPDAPHFFNNPIPLGDVGSLVRSDLQITVVWEDTTVFPPTLGEIRLSSLPEADLSQLSGQPQAYPSHVYDPLPQNIDFIDPLTFVPRTGPSPAPFDTTISYVSVGIGQSGIELTGIYVGDSLKSPNFRITAISVTYTATSSDLLSSNNRILYKEDSEVPGGRRPVMGASMLARIEPDGNSLGVVVLTYSMQPTGALRNEPNELPFLPPDSETDMNFANNADAILREVQFRLQKDPYNGLHYLTALNPDDEFLLFPGQWVVMSSKYGLGGSLPDDKGQDVPQQISRVRNITTADSSGTSTPEVRAYFDLGDEPRVGLTTPLDPTSPPTIYAWVLSPSIQSATPDRSTWTIEPREARRILVPIAN